MNTTWHVRSAGPADLAGLAGLAADSCHANGIEVQENVDGLHHLLAHPGRLDAADVLALATTSTGELAGFHKLGAFRQPDGLQVLTHRGYVHPAWRDRGLGGVLVDHAEHRLAENYGRTGRSAEAVFSAWCYDSEAGVAGLLADRGYRPHRQMLEMRRSRGRDDLPAAALPDGVEIRPVQKWQLPLIWDVYVATQADDIGAVAPMAADYQTWVERPQWDMSLWQVAWHGQKVIGLALPYLVQHAGASPRAYVDHVGVARAWRRAGIGSALLVQSLQQLASRGVDEVLLDVNQANPTGAERLYRRLGFTLSGQLTIVRRPVTHYIR